MRHVLRIRWRLLAVLASPLLAGCGRGPALPEWHEAGNHRWTLLEVEPGAPGFTLLDPARTRIDFVNTIDDGALLENRILANGSGVALGDYDDDGWTDVFFASINGKVALYRNLGGWRFEDATEEAGLARTDRHYTGTSFADFDGDGDLDLLVAAVGAPLTLYRNDGAGRFTDATGEAGLSEPRGGSTLALADVDGDGDLDLYVSNYKSRFAADLFSPQERSFDQVVQRTGDGFEVAPRFREHFRVRVDTFNRVVLKEERAEPDWFFLNDGAGHFERVPLTSGRFLDHTGAPLTEEPEDFGLAARFHDLNGDGAPDLYVCNDFEGADRVWINDGSGTFREAPPTAVRTTSLSSMGVDFSDLDRDGDPEILVVDMLSRDHRRRMKQVPPGASLAKAPGGVAAVLQVPQNVLLLNRGDGTFGQIGDFAGVSASEWSWTPIFLDADLDGHEDLFVSNGYRWEATNADVLEEAKLDVTGVPWEEEMQRYPRLETPNVAFRNNGDLTFEDVTEAWAFGAEDDISHGMAAADLDNDGDLDLVANRWDSPAALYRNEAGAPRLAVRLRGRAPNTQAVGAVIRVSGGPGGDQRKEVTAGGHYLSGSDPLYAFAAGSARELTVTVRWRDGTITEVEGAKPGRLYEIRQDAGTVAPPHPPAPAPQPFFVDASGQLGGHRHEESGYDDFVRQPLLSEMLSRSGPGVSWADVDGDGWDDLIVAGGRDGRPALFLNRQGILRPAPLGLPKTGFEGTAVLPWTENGRTRLLVGQSNFEHGGGVLPLTSLAPVAAVDLSAALRGSGAFQPITPPDSASVGPLALADVDSDGDLDLFVGARTIPGRYPQPATSKLFRNEGGRLVFDEANRGPLEAVGLVSAAVFSDLDGDADPDLLLARDWNSILVLRNEGGRFRDASRELGLADLLGRWNGIATGDLNADGRPDIVVTGWGRNTHRHATPERPIYLYSGDFDRDGTIDPVLAQQVDALGGIAPLQSLSRLSIAIPSVRRRAGTFARFAESTAEQVVGPYLARAERLEARTLEHTLLLSRTDGGYDVRPLPPEAQRSAAFSSAIADFDGDGHEDLFLAQNFFSTENGAPRIDAGTGLWLRGDGSGRLRALSPAESGVRAYGEQRGAALADFDGDGRLDLALAQNGAETRLYRNVRAQPGLRVRLRGPARNPTGVGAVVRAVYKGGGLGPAREVQAGSGFWSQNSPVQVLGDADRIAAVEVRWPGGEITRTVVPPGAREIDVRPGGDALVR